MPNGIGGGGSWRPRRCGRRGGGIRSRRGGRTGAETRTGLRQEWGGRIRATEGVGHRGSAACVRHGGRDGRTGRCLGQGLRGDGPQAPGGLLGRFRGGALGAGRRRGAVARAWRYDAARRARTGGAPRARTGRGLRTRTGDAVHGGVGGGLRGRGPGGPPGRSGAVAACLAAGRRRGVRETGRGPRWGRGQRTGVSCGGHAEVREVGTLVRGAGQDTVRVGRGAWAARRVRGAVGTQPGCRARFGPGPARRGLALRGPAPLGLTASRRRRQSVFLNCTDTPRYRTLDSGTVLPGRRDAVGATARPGRRGSIGFAAAPWPRLPVASTVAPRRPVLVRGLALVARGGGGGAAGGERVEGFRAVPGGPRAAGLGRRVRRGVGVGRGRGGLLRLPVRRTPADRRGLGRARWDGGVLRVRAHAPPVSSRPGRLPVRGPSSLRSTARRRICPSRTRIPVRMDRHPGAGCAAVVVPPYVRVTLRVAPAGTGTSPRARGICPERPPTLR